jgi:hypothetical protein
MLSIAVDGYLKSEGMKTNTDILASLNLGVLTIIIIVAAGATVFTSFIGFMGAYFKNMLVLKLVSRHIGSIERSLRGAERIVIRIRRCGSVDSLPLSSLARCRAIFRSTSSSS